ncbi:hypothetical protein Lser_V15G26501 [Lactuca serriola]
MNCPTHDLELGVVVFSLKSLRWLNVVKDYVYEIFYHPGKDNVMADALIHKTTSTPIMDLCLRVMIVSPLLNLIKKSQVEGLKREYWKEESIMDKISLFVRNSHGLLTRCDNVWVLVARGVRQPLLEEAYKLKFLQKMDILEEKD